MSELLDKAICFAVKKHSGQVRKLHNTPYIMHPMEVATIISTLTEDENTIIAGLLHDTVEDTDTTPEEIKAEFGPRIAALVASETEDKDSSRSEEETWEERKQDTLLMLEHTKDIAVKHLWIGDKLSNIRSFYGGYLEMGDDIWAIFHQKDKRRHEWYYRSIAKYTKELEGTAAYMEFCEIIEKLFA